MSTNWRECNKPGVRWQLKEEHRKEREAYGHGLFEFVIVGPDPHGRANYKLCRLEYANPNARGHGIEQSYSHVHLKRYAIPVKEGA